MKKSKSIKKYVSFFIVCVLLLTAIAGCGSNTKDAPSETSTTTTEGTAVTETEEATEAEATETTMQDVSELEEVHLIWYSIGTPQADQATVNEAMSVITKEKINATIEVRTLDWGVYNDKMNVIMAAGEEFDLCFTSSWANNYILAAPKGAFVALNDPENNLLEKYGQAYLAQVPSKYSEAAKINGVIYATNNYINFSMTNGLKVRRDLADEFGLDPTSIKKFADIEPFLEWVKLNKPDYKPLLLGEGAIQPFTLETGFNMTMATSDWDLPFYVNTDDSEMKVYWYRDLERFNFTRDFYEKDYIEKDAASKDVGVEGNSGKYAVRVPGNIGPYDLKTAGAQDSEYYSIVVSPTYIDTNSVLASMTAISKTSKNPERAMMLLNLMHEDKELYNMLCYGIKDTHYTLEADGAVTSIEGAGYNPGINWEYANNYNALLRPGVPKDFAEKEIGWMDQASVSPVLGFVFDTEPVKTEIAQIKADPDGVAKAVMFGMLSNPEDVIAQYDESISKEIEIVRAEIQKQLDAWKANAKN